MATFFYVLTESLKEAAIFYFQYWWVFTPIILWSVFEVAWVSYRQEKYLRNIEWVLLEVKIPRQEIEKRPKTMEEFFSSLHGVHGVLIDTLYDIYLKGMLELWFSFEIVSIEGDVHFYVRTPILSRGMLESQIYSQYPDAEIKEAEDYVKNVPNGLPNEDYDLWGTDMTLVREDAYPIRTYKEFEDPASGEFFDPVSNIIEGVGKLKRGEQVWIQFLVRPIDDKWKKDADRLVLKLIGRKEKSASGINPLSFIISEFVDMGRYIIHGLFSSVNPIEKTEQYKPPDPVSLMLHLSPGEKAIVTAIDESTKKLGFGTNIRWIYLAKKDVFDKARGNAILFSYFSQFSSLDLNGLTPNPLTKTSAYYFFTEIRKQFKKRSIFRRYKRREFDKRGYVLNTEELATIFHFPTIEVKAPLVPHVEAKKGKPPSTLPI